jgi:hypothetical protein
MPRNMVSGKPSNRSARQVDIPPTTRILVLLVTQFDVWKYVLQGQPGVRFVVALQPYVLHTLGVRMVLQSLVVALIHNPK